MRATCLICGQALTRPATGRPPRYCQPACRRAGELERDRLQRRLMGLEDALAQWRCFPGYERQLTQVQSHIDQAQARLLVLLGAEEEVSSASE